MATRKVYVHLRREHATIQNRNGQLVVTWDSLAHPNESVEHLDEPALMPRMQRRLDEGTHNSFRPKRLIDDVKSADPTLFWNLVYRYESVKAGCETLLPRVNWTDALGHRARDASEPEARKVEAPPPLAVPAPAPAPAPQPPVAPSLIAATLLRTRVVAAGSVTTLDIGRHLTAQLTVAEAGVAPRFSVSVSNGRCSASLPAPVAAEGLSAVLVDLATLGFTGAQMHVGVPLHLGATSVVPVPLPGAAAAVQMPLDAWLHDQLEENEVVHPPRSPARAGASAGAGAGKAKRVRLEDGVAVTH